MHLLLVDDDAALRALLRTTFEAVDVDVEEADSAATAQDALDRYRPDAIVLDVSMPGTDGLALCSQLKQDPSTHDIPVILLTGATHGTEANAAAAGADAFLLKPFSPLELLTVVERLAGDLNGVPLRGSSKH